ncbi:hypothetical protein RJT34_20463 [Clitoria ternatea]|uniref:Uncharacterized protein n=1 Tax=Clitoria ternatea TaxID=43366 RepID=A0AAN9ISV2_CLITE
MGVAGSTVYYNQRLRHPTLDMPAIDYDLALLLQPMLMQGISIGDAFNVASPLSDPYLAFDAALNGLARPLNDV